MNYQEFLNDVQTQLSFRLGSSASLKLQTILKNNGTHHDGLIISRPGVNISPTIYLTPYYHRYLDGVNMEDIYTDILTTYQRHLPQTDFDITSFTDYRKAAGRIVMRLVNYEKNQQLLKEVPHFRYLDFAIIFYCLLHTDEQNQANILIYHKHLHFWNIDTDTLYQAACINTPLLLPYHMENIREIIQKLPAEESGEPEFPSLPMYVLSNHTNLYGASVILYDGLLQQISEHFGKDLILLPSSIHQVLILPADGVGHRHGGGY